MPRISSVVSSLCKHWSSTSKFFRPPMQVEPNDRTPLLENGTSPSPRRSLSRRFFSVLRSEGEPSWVASYRYFLFGSWFNVLLLFVPLSFVSHHLNWDAALRFSFSFFAIVPLAKVRGQSTNHSLSHTQTSYSVKQQTKCPPGSGKL